MPAGVGYDVPQFGQFGGFDPAQDFQGGDIQFGQFGGGGGGGGDFSQILSMTAGKQGQGVDFTELLKSNFKYNFLLPFGLQTGLGLAGNIAGMVGASGRRKRARKEFDTAKGDLTSFSDQDAFNPFLIDALSTGAIYEDAERFGESLEGSLELDAGEARGALISKMLNPRRRQLASNIKERDVMKNRNKQRALEMTLNLAANNPNLYG